MFEKLVVSLTGDLHRSQAQAQMRYYCDHSVVRQANKQTAGSAELCIKAVNESFIAIQY